MLRGTHRLASHLRAGQQLRNLSFKPVLLQDSKKSPDSTHVLEENKYVSSKQIFGELVQHRNKELSDVQKKIHDKSFEIPSELNDINHELAVFKEKNVKDIQPSGYDPVEHTMMRLLFGNLLEEVKLDVALSVRDVVDDDFVLPRKSLTKDVPKELLSLRVKSNILKLKRRDSLLMRSDLVRVFPSKLERQYQWDDGCELDFDMVQGRFPSTLLSNGVIYLVFPSFEHLGCYYLETLNRQLNGQYLHLEFADPVKEFCYIQPHSMVGAPRFLDDLALQMRSMEVPESEELANLADFMQKVRIQELELGLGLELGLELDLLLVSPQFDRSQACFFKNLPRHMTVAELGDTLWDYDLFDIEEASIRKVHEGLWLVILENSEERDRCVREFDGVHWYHNSDMPLVGVELF